MNYCIDTRGKEVEIGILLKQYGYSKGYPWTFYDYPICMIYDNDKSLGGNHQITSRIREFATVISFEELKKILKKTNKIPKWKETEWN